jgi:hypothetical protein
LAKDTQDFDATLGQRSNTIAIYARIDRDLAALPSEAWRSSEPPRICFQTP